MARSWNHKQLFVKDSPYKHRVEKDARTYNRNIKHKPQLEDYLLEDEVEDSEEGDDRE